MLQQRQRALSLLLATLALGCSSPSGLGTMLPLSADATVRFSSLEGGCWSLATANAVYEPVNLPSAFRIDGLAVRVVLRDAPDRVSICMMAPLVYVDSIRVR